MVLQVEYIKQEERYYLEEHDFPERPLKSEGKLQMNEKGHKKMSCSTEYEHMFARDCVMIGGSRLFHAGKKKKQDNLKLKTHHTLTHLSIGPVPEGVKDLLHGHNLTGLPVNRLPNDAISLKRRDQRHQNIILTAGTAAGSVITS